MTGSGTWGQLILLRMGWGRFSSLAAQVKNELRAVQALATVLGASFWVRVRWLRNWLMVVVVMVSRVGLPAWSMNLAKVRR